MRLVETNRINLDDRVFGRSGLMGDGYGTIRPYNSGITAITVRHLLNHTAGGWTNDGNDPMFRDNNLSTDALISNVLDNRPLNNTPGTTYAYSNFGYCILGRLIERVSGQTYDNYVRTQILNTILI